MKIVTWNINGIRSTKKPLKELLDSLGADIICLQETKVTKDLLESEIALIEGYSSYFSFSRAKTGYSGVATYCKDSCTPTHAQSGLTHLYQFAAGNGSIVGYGEQTELFSTSRLEQLDKEGRAIITQHTLSDAGDLKTLTVINVYCPRADPEKEDRRVFKLDFYKLLEERSKSLLSQNSAVVIVGDLNTSHRQIDHCDPNNPVDFYDNPARVWMDHFLADGFDYTELKRKNVGLSNTDKGGMFVDSFRYFYPKKQDMFTCWCTSNRARQTNYGTRIDYIFIDRHFITNCLSCEIMSDFVGSDHCPVIAQLNASVISAKECPPLCSKFSTEFFGKQQKLSSYFSNSQSQSDKQMPPEKLNKVKKPKGKSSSQSTLKTYFKSNTKVDKLPVSDAVIFKPVVKKSTSNMTPFWKTVLKGPEPPPLCKGHQEPCVLRTVKKKGPNLGKQFYCCGKPEGLKSNPSANCQHFEWKTMKKSLS